MDAFLRACLSAHHVERMRISTLTRRLVGSLTPHSSSTKRFIIVAPMSSRSTSTTTGSTHVATSRRSRSMRRRASSIACRHNTQESVQRHVGLYASACRRVLSRQATCAQPSVWCMAGITTAIIAQCSTGPHPRIPKHTHLNFGTQQRMQGRATQAAHIVCKHMAATSRLHAHVHVLVHVRVYICVGLCFDI